MCNISVVKGLVVKCAQQVLQQNRLNVFQKYLNQTTKTSNFN